MSPQPVRFHVSSFLLGVLLCGLVAGLLVLLTRAPQPPPIVLHPPPTPAPPPTAPPTATPAPIVVYVSGAVSRPGLYSVAVDGRVGDALEMAGGLREDAAADSLNLAERLWDGARVHVSSRQEAESATVEAAESANPAGQPASGVSGMQLPTPIPDSLHAGGVSGNGRINLNTASPSELESLPGIGPTRAQAIIENRPYTRIEEVTRVPGIGDGILAQMRDFITVE